MLFENVRRPSHWFVFINEQIYLCILGCAQFFSILLIKNLLEYREMLKIERRCLKQGIMLLLYLKLGPAYNCSIEAFLTESSSLQPPMPCLKKSNFNKLIKM